METRKPKAKTSTIIIGLAAVVVIIFIFALIFAGGDDLVPTETPATPGTPKAQSIPTAPSDHGHAH